MDSTGCIEIKEIVFIGHIDYLVSAMENINFPSGRTLNHLSVNLIKNSTKSLFWSHKLKLQRSCCIIFIIDTFANVNEFRPLNAWIWVHFVFFLPSMYQKGVP